MFASSTPSDMDAVPVAHALPERVAATLWANDPNMGDTGWAAVQYVNGGEHEVVLSPLYVGNYTLSLKLDGVRVDIVRRVVVNCGKDRVAIDGGWACGCESGFEPNADAAGYDSKTSMALCVLCEKSTWSQPGAATCLPCPAFSTTAAKGSADITQCLVECGLQTLSCQSCQLTNSCHARAAVHRGLLYASGRRAGAR